MKITQSKIENLSLTAVLNNSLHLRTNKHLTLNEHCASRANPCPLSQLLFKPAKRYLNILGINFSG